MLASVRSTLRVLIREFLQICLLQKRPQDIPASMPLFALSLSGYGLISAVLLLPTQSFGYALLTGLIEASMLLLITFAFVYLRSVPARWLQTSTALAGTGTVFSLMALPLFYWRVFLPIGPGAETFIGLLVMVLVFWNIAVMTHILRHALSSNWILGLLGSITYIALISYALQQLLPVGEGG